MGSVGSLSNLELKRSRLTSARSRKSEYHTITDLPISPVLPLMDKRVRSVLTLRQIAWDVRAAHGKITGIIGPIHLLPVARRPKQPTSSHLSCAPWCGDGVKINWYQTENETKVGALHQSSLAKSSANFHRRSHF